MAERRMFAKSIIDSDAFLTMPTSTQLLYFHLCMRADDDGFVNSPRSIQKMIGSSDDDFKILLAKRFLLPFDSGIIVIKHWRIHNYIQSDRYCETKYLEEKSMLGIKKNKAYTFLSDSDDCTPLPCGNTRKNKRIQAPEAEELPDDIPEKEDDQECIHDVYMVDTQVRLGKDSIDKDIEEKENTKKKKTTDKKGLNVVLDEYEISGDLREALNEFIDMREKKKRPLTQRALRGVLNKLINISTDYETQVKVVDQSLEHSWDTVYEIRPNYASRTGPNGITIRREEDHSLDGVF